MRDVLAIAAMITIGALLARKQNDNRIYLPRGQRLIALVPAGTGVEYLTTNMSKEDTPRTIRITNKEISDGSEQVIIVKERRKW